MRNALEIETLTTDWCKLIRVVYQKYRGPGFYKGENSYIYKGFALYSSKGPRISISNGLFVRGMDKTEDDKILIVPNNKWFEKAMEAINAYNEEMSILEKSRISGRLEYYMKLPYAIRIVPEDAGGYFAEIEEFPGCMTHGDTVLKVIENIDDAKRNWLTIAIEEGLQIPEPKLHKVRK